jgi:hypothetical protein
MRGLAIAAWSTLGLDAALVVLIAVFGLIATEPVEQATMFVMAVAAAVPLAVVGAILYVSTRRRSRAGLSICLALAVTPLILLLWLIAEQNVL